MKSGITWFAVFLMILGVVGLIVGFPTYKWGSGTSTTAKSTTPSSAKTVVELAPGKSAVVIDNKAVIVRSTNTSDDCPGQLSPLQELSGSRVSEFNPKGCRFYAYGTGPVAFSGLFFGEVERDLSAKGWDTGARIVYAARAVSGTVKWRYILCAGAKQHMDKEDCT